MASVNQTRSHCVNQMGKTHSKPLAARHGRGTAWARHAMCESALRVRVRDSSVAQDGGEGVDVSVVGFARRVAHSLVER
jgi:hypothetical protein